jgi:hypothetical protein
LNYKKNSIIWRFFRKKRRNLWPRERYASNGKDLPESIKARNGRLNLNNNTKNKGKRKLRRG